MHTGLCTLLENAFAILAIAIQLGICLAFHVEYSELEQCNCVFEKSGNQSISTEFLVERFSATLDRSSN
jgi:hypothetical protein